MKLIRDVPEVRTYLGLSSGEMASRLNASRFSVILGGEAPAYRDSAPLADENAFRLEM